MSLPSINKLIRYTLLPAVFCSEHIVLVPSLVLGFVLSKALTSTYCEQVAFFFQLSWKYGNCFYNIYICCDDKNANVNNSCLIIYPLPYHLLDLQVSVQ